MIVIHREHILDGLNFESLYCVLNNKVQIMPNQNIVFTENTTISLNEDEKTILTILNRYKDSDLSLTEAELSFYFLVEKGIYCENDLIDEISKLKVAVSNIEPQTIKNNRHGTVEVCYILSGCNGTVSKEGEKFLSSKAACKLVSDAIVDSPTLQDMAQNDADFLKYIWEILMNLVSKEIVIKFYPLKRIKNFYYMPERNILFQLIDAKTKESEYITALFRKYSDLSNKTRNNLDIRYDEYSGKEFPFSTNRFTSAGISITTDCQYRCEYCSFESGDNKSLTLDINTIKAFVDYMIKNAILKKMITNCVPSIDIIIAGGGEPTFKWKVFTECVDYIREQSQKNNILCNLKITTNGYHTPEQTQYIMKNFNSVTISFDGTPDLQNQNRHLANGLPTFEIVDRTLKMLDSAYFNYSIIAVVQPNDFSKLTDISSFVFRNYPNIRNLSLRPSMSVGRAVKKGLNTNIMDFHFAANYFDMMKALGYPMKVSCGLFHERFIGSFCGALYGNHPWLIPNGSIVTCQDAKEKSIVIGNVQNETVVMHNVHDVYADISHKFMDRCKICRLYERCKGGCPLSKNSPESYTFQQWSCREAAEFLDLKLVHLLKTGFFRNTYIKREILENFTNLPIYSIKNL